jgi:hypothetical protein
MVPSRKGFAYYIEFRRRVTIVSRASPGPAAVQHPANPDAREQGEELTQKNASGKTGGVLESKRRQS